MLSYALTTVARTKTFLGISGTSYDTLLERLIDSATDFIEHWCDRRFKQQNVTNEVYDGSGSQVMVLKQYPVATASTFTIQVRDSADNASSWSTVDSGDYFVATSGVVNYVNGTFVKLPQHYRFTYTAGYNFDNSATFLSDTSAADLEYVCWKLVGKLFSDRKTSSNIQSESLGDYSVSYTRELMLDKELKEILDKYRRTPSR